MVREVPQKPLWLDIVSTKCTVVSHSEEDRSHTFDRTHFGQQVIVTIQDNGTTVLHILDHLRFFLKDSLSCLEELQMCDTDIGDHTDVRAGYRRETAHLTEMLTPISRIRQLLCPPAYRRW